MNLKGVGNVVGTSSSAEFNFFVDPESVQVVFDSFEGCPIYDLPWEIMLKTTSSYVKFLQMSNSPLRIEFYIAFL